MDLRFGDEAFGVHQQMPLSSFYLLAAVETPVLPVKTTAVVFTDRVESTTPALGALGVPFEADPEAFADGPIDPLPGSV